MSEVKVGEGLAKLCCAFIVAAIILGGGGSPSAFTEMLLQLTAVAVATAWLVLERRSGSGGRLSPVHPSLVILCVIMIAVPLLQMIPLPPAVWQSLPGRETEQRALALIGEADSWRPLTLSPARTLAGLLSLGPPLLAMLLVARLDAAGRIAAIKTVAAMALVSAVLGVLQASSSSDAFQLYRTHHSGWATGFQANRNAMADLLLIGILATGVAAAATPGAVSRSIRLAAAIAATLLLITVVVLTGSRTGLSLLLIVVPLQGLLLAQLLEVRRAPQVGFALAALVLLGAVGAYLLQSNFVVDRTAARFLLGEDPRFDLWEDTRFAIAQLWPWGAGMGTFTPTLLTIERLEVVDPSWPNRAHNDYLEFALEAGLPGMLLGAAAVVVVLALAVRAWRTPPAGRQAVLFSLCTFGIITLHSLVDYPLRSMALAVLMGLGVGLIAPPVDVSAPRARQAHGSTGAVASSRRQGNFAR